MGVVAILISLALLMYGAYRGISVLILAPLLAAFAVLLSGDVPWMGTYTQIFMAALGKFAVKYFPIFLMGSIFGKLMEVSGFARSISQGLLKMFGHTKAILSIVLACGLLTYGGVSAFVVVFTIYPLASALFWELKIPKRLVPGTIALGAFTFSMTALPGSSQIHNLIPMTYFGTTAFAAPLLGSIAGLAMFVLGGFWLQRRARQARELGEGYGYEDEFSGVEERSSLPFVLAVLPIVLVISSNYLFSEYFIPGWQTDYLSSEKFGAVGLPKVLGIWSMLLALVIGISSLLIYMFVNSGMRKRIARTVNEGAMGSLLPTFNTASEVGYGATIATLAGFALIRDGIFSVSPGSPLLAEVLSINVLAGITGSASGGLSIALEALGKQFITLGQSAGISNEIMHRVASLSSGGLDTFPHNGAVITLLTVCGLSHRESYKDIAVVSLVVPLLVTVTLVGLGSLLGVFAS